MEPRLRASPKQFSVLIEFMERHGDIARPQPGIQARLKAESLWLELGRQLNSIEGGVHKSYEKWKKVWADWKTKTKGKFLRIRKQAHGAVGGPSSRSYLTALEERVLAVTGVSGQIGIQEKSLNTTSTSQEESGLAVEVTHSEDIYLTTTSNVSVRPSPPHGRNSEMSVTPPLACETSSSPPLPPLPPLLSQPHIHSTQSQRSQIRASPWYRNTTPRQSLLGARRNKGSTPFDRAAAEFAAIEQRRLEHEEIRDRRLHEREMERLQVESQRIEVSREHNQLLHQLIRLGQHLIDVLSRQQQFADSP